MSSTSCGTPMMTLLAYWVGELDADDESDIEDHLFGCAECAARLCELAQLGDGIRGATREGRLFSILTPRFIRRLQETGLRIREYRMHPGGSVLCTVAPEDDLAVGHLHADLTGVDRLDAVIHDVTAGLDFRLENVAFDPAADEVVLVPSIIELRRLTHATMRVELLAVQSTAEKLLGEYLFNHHPHV